MGHMGVDSPKGDMGLGVGEIVVEMVTMVMGALV